MKKVVQPTLANIVGLAGSWWRVGRIRDLLRFEDIQISQNA